MRSSKKDVRDQRHFTVWYCHDCRTDLRLKNVLTHLQLDHRVEHFNTDPRLLTKSLVK